MRLRMMNSSTGTATVDTEDRPPFLPRRTPMDVAEELFKAFMSRGEDGASELVAVVLVFGSSVVTIQVEE